MRPHDPQNDLGDDEEYEDPDDEYDAEEIANSFAWLELAGGPMVPDLRLIPRDRWVDALRPLGPSARLAASRLVEGQEASLAAQMALIELHGEDYERRQKALTESAPPPAPQVVMPRGLAERRSHWRQVSFRLSEREREDLDRAARLYAVSGARLARMLTMRGVKRALRDG